MRRTTRDNASTRRARPASRSGFTILELLVVMALLAIVSAIAIPYTMEAIQRSAFVSTVDCTANLLRVARLQAIRRNENVGVEVDGRLLRVATDEPHAPSCQLSAVVATVAVDGWSTNGGEPVFLPNGSGAENGAFRLTDDRGNQLEVRLEPAAVGRIEVRKYNGLTWVGRDQGGWKWH